MNITEYRVLKAQEEAQKSQNPDQTVVQNVQQVTNQNQPTEPVKPETKPEQPVAPVVPEKIAIDGIGEVTIDELKNGYMRTQDYTRKTQDVSKQRKEAGEAIALYEQLKANPQIVQTLKQTAPVPPSLDPTQAKVVELENRLYDMMLENEISSLQRKYSDFEVREVLDMAQKKNMTNLEDAYLLVKSTKTPATQQPLDAEALKLQLRAEIIKELQAENNTSSIIAPGGSPVVSDNNVQLSDEEKKVASRMFRNVADPFAEYVKWRDVGSRNANKK